MRPILWVVSTDIMRIADVFQSVVNAFCGTIYTGKSSLPLYSHGTLHVTDMGILYDQAVDIICREARGHSQSFQTAEETVPLENAVARITKNAYYCPGSTPRWDTSAMDGYALNSDATRDASEAAPATFKIKATIAAGDCPVSLAGDPEDGVYPCVEIATGARFPRVTSGKPFDCCVRLEDTKIIEAVKSGQNYVQVFRPAKPHQNKRLAGEDFQTGKLIIGQHALVRPQHVMALASVACTALTVLRTPRIGLFSTGSELAGLDSAHPEAQRIPDVNRPYIQSILECLGYRVDFLGLIEDGPAVDVARKVSQRLKHQSYDVVIFTGAASAGKRDFVRNALEELGARILFHQVAMRPGHPALFASLRSSEATPSNLAGSLVQHSNTAVFGLPGNPVAAATCIRFLVLPYLHTLASQPLEPPIPAFIVKTEQSPVEKGVHSDEASLIASFPAGMDIFRAGKITSKWQPGLEIELIRDHSPSKIRPFLDSDCWIHIHRGQTELHHGDTVDVFLMT